MKVEWSADALADLDRFAAFLHQHHPHLANVVAGEIIDKVKQLFRAPTPWPPPYGADSRASIWS